jgi:hypothetical protein
LTRSRRGEDRPTAGCTGPESASAFAVGRNASGCLKPPSLHLRSAIISKWSSASWLWAAAMNLQNGYRISPSRSGTATSRGISRLSWRPRSRANGHPPCLIGGSGGSGIHAGRASTIVFLLCRRLVATTLPARDRASIISFDRGSHHPAVSPWADRDAAWADADGDV